ncbi:MAG: alpha-E domain-containing protein [Gammaproteobacteria bacterium]|nr:alpha-E domain-containing protein [Gammaproteobacteria bacterium]
MEQELSSVLFDPDSPDGLALVLANLGRTAEAVRERLSADTWRMLEQLTEAPNRGLGAPSIGEATRQLNEMTENLSAINGMIQENMTRGYGWRLLDLGRRIERSRFYARLIRDIAVTGSPEESGVLHLLLELGDCEMTYRSRYKATPQLPAVLDLLLTDDSNPRSLAFQFDEIGEHLALMPLEQKGGLLSTSQRTVIAVRSELQLADVVKLATVKTKAGRRTHLARLLDRVEEGADELSEVITLTYFSHAIEHRVSGSRRGDAQT